MTVTRPLFLPPRPMTGHTCPCNERIMVMIGQGFRPLT
jgi:hypothetical protein